MRWVKTRRGDRRLRREPQDMDGPTKLGEVGKDWDGNWYLVRKVGPAGGTSGPCIYGPRKKNVNFNKLRSATVKVPPSRWPPEIKRVVAAYALTGEII